MAAGKSKKWQLEEYRRLMGEESAARQTATAKATKDIKVRCKCTQSSTRRAEEIGPYHRVSCPMYAPA